MRKMNNLKPEQKQMYTIPTLFNNNLTKRIELPKLKVIQYKVLLIIV